MANEIWTFNEPVCVTYFNLIDDTVYLEFDISKNGFMGISVWLEKIERVVKKNLIKNDYRVLNVIFESPPTI